MYKKYRIIILTICTLIAIILVSTIDQALYYISSKEKLDQYESILVGIATISFFLNFFNTKLTNLIINKPQLIC